MVRLLPLAGGACVVRADWMETLQPTVAAHAVWLGVLGEFAFGLSIVFFATMATACATTTAVWYVFFVGHRFCVLGDLVQYGLDL